ncbi:hypothetical protein F5887DRAFT_1077658 [Amanita rubescens]|nr:hypothetical protein F5887DRAFT_1077658 [Amanita rubescens]
MNLWTSWAIKTHLVSLDTPTDDVWELTNPILNQALGFGWSPAKLQTLVEQNSVALILAFPTFSPRNIVPDSEQAHGHPELEDSSGETEDEPIQLDTTGQNQTWRRTEQLQGEVLLLVPPLLLQLTSLEIGN